ncbi:hypothetical protein [Lactiplantibacillus herbarum]|uniref:hypothetical protein n=1 Tax=Lactiplantibacillus herbarum TaxID=1670446 RepID=UPI00064F259F|nr:hypothetical protein [Lactiplantibacillus herbarum]
MEINPFTASLPNAAGQTKLQTDNPNLTADDTATQTGNSYYWYELTKNGIHQWRLIASWPVDQTVTTMIPGMIDTVLYPQQPVMEMLIDDWVGHFDPVLTLTDQDQVTHRLWQITEQEVNEDITATMASVTPRKTWLTTTSKALVMLLTAEEWQKLTPPPTVPDQLIQMVQAE